MAATTRETISLDNWTGRRADVVVYPGRTKFVLFDYIFDLVRVEDPNDSVFCEATWQIMLANRQLGSVVESNTEVYAANNSWDMTRTGSDKIEAAVRLIANLL